MLDPSCIFEIPDVYFEAQDLPRMHVPTLLYGLKPSGVGTGACESLKSYICRLAHAHKVGPRLLLKEALFTKLVAKNGFWRNRQSDLTSGKTQSPYISLGDTTKGLVDVLSEATGVHSLGGCKKVCVNGH